MKSADYILLVATFLLGSFVGGYLYVTVYKPNVEAQLDIFTELDWEIIGRETGPCENVGNCSELYLASNRGFKLSDDGHSFEEGYVSGPLRNQISDTLTKLAADRPFDSVCHLQTASRTYFYDIEAYGTRWQSATCDEDFMNTDLDNLLDAAWYEARTGKTSVDDPIILEEGFSSWLEETFRQRFYGEE